VDDTTENPYPIDIYTKYKTLASAASLLSYISEAAIQAGIQNPN